MSNGVVADPTVPVGAVGAPVATQYRSIAALLQTGNLTTTSTIDASIQAFTLLGGTLGTANAAVRLRASGRQSTQAGSFNIKFGATVLFTVAPLTGENWHCDVTVTRVGGTSQHANGWTIHNATAAAIAVSPGETLASDIVIDFRGSVTSGGTLSLDEALVEYISSV